VSPGDRATTVPSTVQPPPPAIPLDRLPVALGIDASGRLLVGNRRAGTVERIDVNGRRLSTIAIPRRLGEQPPDPTDVLPAADGQSLLVVDNDNHCVKEISASGEMTVRYGQRGSGPGEMRYPATAARDGDGRLWVVDVLNARVDVFERDGRSAGSIGSRGVTVGKFYRPKGIAVDPRGRVHVTDSLTGVVQTFDRGGQVVGAWGDTRGQLHRLRSPTTILADGAGRYYVVETLANHVSVWRERAK
jgi:DNA-binding beta-propeller fold protein YncE